MSKYDDAFDTQLPPGIDGIELIEIEMNPDLLSGMTVLSKKKDGTQVARIFVNPKMKRSTIRTVVVSELAHLHTRPVFNGSAGDQIGKFFEDIEKPRKPRPQPELTVSGVLIPETSVPHGVLIKSVSVLWRSIVEEVTIDWSKAYEIPSDVWEELIAGAFHNDGFDSVVLTPRSGDFGRDVIATRKGVGCIKIIGSVKAYKPGHLVKHDDVRALLGVLSGEQDASKGIITTTSGFAPRITSDPFIKPFLPTRLELLDGPKLREWLTGLSKK